MPLNLEAYFNPQNQFVRGFREVFKNKKTNEKKLIKKLKKDIKKNILKEKIEINFLIKKLKKIF